MAIYSAKYAKELIAESICLDESADGAPSGVKIRAVLKGETKQRVFHISSLLADNGRQEIRNLVASLQANPKKGTDPDHRNARPNSVA